MTRSKITSFAIVSVLCALIACAALAMTGCSGSGSSSAASSGSSSASSSSASSQGSSSTASKSTSSSTRQQTIDGPVPTADFVASEDQWGNLFPTLGDKAVEFGRRVQNELPVKAHVRYSGMAGGIPVEFTDPGTIRAMFNCLATANIGDPAAMISTDDYTDFWLEFEDGTGFGLNLDSMSVGIKTDGKYMMYYLDANKDFERFAVIAHEQYNRNARGGR